jgi:hypothetical protein
MKGAAKTNAQRSVRGRVHLAAAVFVLVSLFNPLAPLALLAATLAGVTLPDRIQVHDRALILNGIGVRKVTIFRVKVYLVALYLEARSADAKQILQSPQRKRLVLHFLHSASRDQIMKAWRDGLRRNVPDIRPLESRLQTLATFIPNLEKGDRIVFDFGSESSDVEIVGHARTTVAGADFSRAMLGIWLGPKAPADDLQTGLLGK